MIKHRVIARVEFHATERGGKARSIDPGAGYGCPVLFENAPYLSSHAYDCRFLLWERRTPIQPGDVLNEAALVFLSEDEVLPHIGEGTRFILWEGREVGQGVVLRVDPMRPEDYAALRLRHTR